MKMILPVKSITAVTTMFKTIPPFSTIDNLSENKILILGVLIVILASLTASLGYMHFDGLINMHLSPETLPFYIPFIETLINVAALSLTLLIPAQIWSQEQYSLQGIFSYQLFARLPFIFAPLPFISNRVREASRTATNQYLNEESLEFVHGVFLALGIALIIFFVLLSYKAFIKATGATPKRSFIAFVGAILLAEMISKKVIVMLFLA